MSDEVLSPDGRPDQRPRALLKRGSGANQTYDPVLLLARTGGKRTIRVQETGKPTPGVFGVHPWDLVDPRSYRIIDRAVLNALPWAGKGDDPLDPEGKRAIAARLAPSIPDRILP
ncbi:MAG TPA: hypothetical protein VFB13_17715 [Reyranella sp.]|nr:hypothetical protein [Reyranella sp.]